MDYITTTQVLTVAAAIIAAMFGLLMAVTGWIGSKLYKMIADIVASLRTIERDMHGHISALDRRVTRLEERDRIRMGAPEHDD